MSVCNIIQEPDAIHIWSDGAVYSPTGVLVATAAKTFLLPAIHAAMVVSGELLVANALAVEAQIGKASFDDLIDWFPGFMAKVRDDVSEMAGFEAQPTVARLAGWSERRQRLEVWSAAAGETVHHGSGKAVLIEPDDVLVSPASGELMTRLEKAGLSGPDGLNAETPGDWLQVLREQRACAFPYEYGGNHPIRMVGGFAQHTVITRDALTTRVVERWAEDRVGEKMVA